MVKAETTWSCDLCGRFYKDSERAAQACEERCKGKEEYLKPFKRGMFIWHNAELHMVVDEVHWVDSYERPLPVISCAIIRRDFDNSLQRVYDTKQIEIIEDAKVAEKIRNTLYLYHRIKE